MKFSDLPITEKQRNEIIEQTAEAVLVFNNEGYLVYGNDSGCAMLDAQLVKCEEEAKNRYSCPLLADKRNKSFVRFIKNQLKEASFVPEVVQFTTNTGKRNLEARVMPLKENGVSQGILVMLANVTDAYTLRRHEKDSAVTFIGLITVICAYLFTWSLFEFTLDKHLSTVTYTHMIEGISFLLFIYILIFTSLKPRDVGLFVRPRTFLKTLWMVIPGGILVCGILILANYLMRLMGHPIKEYFIGGSLAGMQSYVFTAILQEFLSRGVIQTTVRSLMKIRFQKFWGVFMSSLLFSLMHLPFGFPFMIGAFLLGIILGIIFEKTENIWGCALLHWGVGYLAMAMFF